MKRRHKNATTTLAQRRQIQKSPLSDRMLADQLGVSIRTVRRWRGRTEVRDLPHTAHSLPTTLTPFQERVVVAFRRHLLLSLDDLLVVTRMFLNPAASRSGLDRCLRRQGLASIRALRKAWEVPGFMPSAGPGTLRIVRQPALWPSGTASDTAQHAAIDVATHWLFMRPAAEASESITEFLDHCVKAAPFRVEAALFPEALWADIGGDADTHIHSVSAGKSAQQAIALYRLPTSSTDDACNANLAADYAPFAAGMDYPSWIKLFVHQYNHRAPQKALKNRTPMQAIRDWRGLDQVLYQSCGT